MRVINVGELLRDSPELAWMGEEARIHLASIARLELYNPREVIFQGSSDCPSLMLVVSGAIHSIVVSGNQDKLERIYYENQIYGLGELFNVKNDKERLIVAEANVLILSIPMEEARVCLSKCQDTQHVFDALNRNFEAYHFIRNSTFLGDLLSPLFLVEFVSFFELKSYRPKECVFQQDDAPDGFYLCSSGKLKVQVIKNEKVVFAAPLQAGDYFGELALTNDGKRSATIMALSEARCYYLSRTNFNTLVKHEPRLLEGFELLAKLAYGN